MMDVENVMDKSYKKRQAALRKRLALLPKDNPVVKKAKKRLNREDESDRYAEFEVVHDLVSSASAEFVDGEMSFKVAVKNLGEALLALAKNK